jgi:putative ABC transport system permease protein
MLLKRPGYTAIAIIALALGISANSAIFSVVNTLLLRPLPYQNPDRLVMVWENYRKENNPHNAVAPANFVDWTEQNQVFEQMAAFTAPISFNFTGGDAPERVVGARVTAGFLPLLGVKPLQGRLFTEEEDRPDNNLVILISHKLWQRRFGSDPSVVGRTFTLSGRTYLLAGILPPDFKMPPDFQSATLENVDVWTPLALSPEGKKRRSSHPYNVIARLKPGVTLERAQAEMSSIGSRLEQQYPETNTGWGVSVNTMQEEFVGRVRSFIYILFGAVCFVLLIACANVANLLLARATGRHKEIAIRAALGAGRARLIRQLLTESVLLALMGGALGYLLAMWGVRLLVAFSPGQIPRIREVQLDTWVLGYTLLISVLTGIVFGLAPALQVSKPDLNDALKEGGRSGSDGQRLNSVRGFLVVAEVAIALVLLVGAGLMMRSFMQLQKVDTGFDPHNVLTMQVTLPPLKYKGIDDTAAFYDQALQRIETLPGVEAAGKVSELPLSGDQFDNAFSIDGRPPLGPGEELHANLRLISAGYFKAMGIPVRRGRAFAQPDAQGKPGVVVINEAMARRYWPNEDPLGKRLTIDMGDAEKPREIVGIVGDIRHYALDIDPKPEMYVPNMPAPQNIMTMVVRSKTDPQQLAASIRREVLNVDKDQPIYNVKTMEQIVADSVASQRFSMILLGVLATIALALAVVGIYGVMAYWVTQRTHEIGIRMALGAQPSNILKLVVRQGLSLALIGVGIGLLASFALTRVLSTLLYQVSSTDLLTFVGTPLLLSFVALVASLIPARKATRVDPMVALRYQ